MKPIAELQGISKRYGRGNTTVTALRAIDLTIYPGEMTLIEGPSGCGKTTLLEVLGLLLPPDEGQVLIDGRRASGLGQAESTRLRRKNIAFIFQDFNLLESLKARDNIALVARLHGPNAGARTTKALQALDLTHRAHHRPAELSGGEKQRVAIGRAMVSGAKLLLADEPTANLDWGIGKTIVRILADFARDEGRGVVMVSHDARLEEYADRVVTLRDGSIVNQRQTARTGGALIGIIAMLAALALVLAAWFVNAHSTNRALPSNGGSGNRLEHLAVGNGEEVVASAPAVTEPPSRLISLSCDRPGIITAIPVASGQQVKRNQILVQLDDSETLAQQALSEAQLGMAEAALADIKAWMRAEEIDQAKAEVAADEARVAFDEWQFEQMKHMKATSVAAPDEVERAQQNLAVSKANLQKAQAVLAKAMNGPTPTAVAQAQARVVEARAAVQVARAAVERRCLRSPVDGVVMYVYMRPGEAIDLQSPQPILSLAESGPMHLRADVDEADIGRVFVGQNVVASSESFDQTFSGKVVFAEPIMGRRNIRTNRPQERRDTRIREVVIELQDSHTPLPMDLMMTVRFLKQSGSTSHSPATNSTDSN